MQPRLFDSEIEYGSDFETAWRAYFYTRGKEDGWRAWGQTVRYRPEMPLLLICISEYRAELRKTKLAQAYFASWLRGKRWMDHLAEARYRLNNPLPGVPARKSFRASDYPDVPEELRPKKTAAQILAEHAARRNNI